MRIPKGFGRNYFSLIAIQATVAAITIHAVQTAAQLLSHQFSSEKESEDDPNDPLLAQLTPLTLASEPDPRLPIRSCHCNCYFKRKTRNIFISLYSKFRPKYFCPYIVSGIAPPSHYNYYLIKLSQHYKNIKRKNSCTKV